MSMHIISIRNYLTSTSTLINKQHSKIKWLPGLQALRRPSSQSGSGSMPLIRTGQSSVAAETPMSQTRHPQRVHCRRCRLEFPRSRGRGAAAGQSRRLSHRPGSDAAAPPSAALCPVGTSQADGQRACSNIHPQSALYGSVIDTGLVCASFSAFAHDQFQDLRFATLHAFGSIAEAGIDLLLEQHN